MIDVEVTNFQSIERASIKIDGFTALVGRSNIGKSALVRALKAALTGASGTSFVRHSASCARRTKKAKTCECYCTVHLTTEGFDLKWEKGDKRNRYMFNGQTYDRTATGTPEFLLRPALAQDFSSVSIARDSKLLQVADQFDNVFLLDQTGGTVADVLSDVARLDCINVAMRLVEKDRKEAASTRKVREKDMLDLQAKVDGYQGLDVVTADAQRVGRKLVEISKTQEEVVRIGRYLDETGTLDTQIVDLTLASDTPIPDLALVGSKQTFYERIYSLWAQASEKAGVVKGLSGVDHVADLDLKPVAVAATRAETLTLWVERFRAYQEVFAKAKPVETSSTPDATTMVGEQNKYAVLVRYGAQISTLTAKVDELASSCASAEAEAQSLLDETREVYAELAILGVCPTCTQTISSEPHLHRSVA